MFERTGDTTPPCGQPLSVSRYCQSSRYPALSMLAIIRRNLLSWIFSARILTITSWFKDPKQSAISPSMNHTVPVQVWLISVGNRSIPWRLRQHEWDATAGLAPVSGVFPADEELHLLGAGLQAIQLS